MTFKLSSANPNISISGANAALADFVFPATRPVAITLVVTDTAGRQDTASLTVDPSLGGSTSGGGGGGGSLDAVLLGLLASLAGLLSSRRRRIAGN